MNAGDDSLPTPANVHHGVVQPLRGARPRYGGVVIGERRAAYVRGFV